MMADETPWQNGKTLLESIYHMSQHEVATDVTFVIEDRKVKAHKFILISRSPAFEAMFIGPMSKQQGQEEIPIADVSKEAFNIFLRYMYTDNIDINIDNVVDILKVADKYLVDTLTEKCYSFLEDHLNPDNVCHMRERYHSFPNEKLLAGCRRVEEESACDVLESAGFTHLCKDCVHELISSDDLAVDEEDVYKAVTGWAEAECKRQKIPVTDANKRNCLGELIYHVRFPVMNAAYFCRHVFQQSVLSNTELVELHRYIHNQSQFNQSLVTEWQDDSYSYDTHNECCCSMQSNHEQLSRKCDCAVEAHQQKADICGFDCKYRVGYRKGKHQCVMRQKSTNCVIGKKIGQVNEHFQTTSLVYIHGIITPFRADQIVVSINDEVVRSEMANDDINKVLFRKVLPIPPNKDNVIHVKVKNEEPVERHPFKKDLHFEDVIIKFSDSSNGCNGFVTGLLLSKERIK